MKSHLFEVKKVDWICVNMPFFFHVLSTLYTGKVLNDIKLYLSLETWAAQIWKTVTFVGNC